MRQCDDQGSQQHQKMSWESSTIFTISLVLTTSWQENVSTSDSQHSPSYNTPKMKVNPVIFNAEDSYPSQSITPANLTPSASSYFTLPPVHRHHNSIESLTINHPCFPLLPSHITNLLTYPSFFQLLDLSPTQPSYEPYSLLPSVVLPSTFLDSSLPSLNPPQRHKRLFHTTP